MKCAHCLTSFHDKPDSIYLKEDSTSKWYLIKRTCPACGKYIISLKEYYERYRIGAENRYHYSRDHMSYPLGISRSPISADVPQEFANDYKEACLTLSSSPKASAALGRRCLQHILREKMNVKNGNLADEIQQVIDNGQLPTHLVESLDAIRNIGNFAAHPIKSTSSGEVIEVEPGEAEWNLDVLESLFDHIFVQPELLKRKREALNAKLKEAGKPELK